MRWNEKFEKLLKTITENSDGIDANPDMLQTYVDDLKSVMKELPPGAEFDSEATKIVINRNKIEDDLKIPSDRRTFEVLKNIANTIDKDVQFTVDVPSDSKDNKMAFLDTKCWMEYGDKNHPQGKIMHQHYVKPMTAKVGVQIESALSDKVKRTINTQDTIRVLRNCHEDLPEDELNKILSENMKKLQNSGYPEQYRREILISALNGFEKQKEADRNGLTPLYRPKGYMTKERAAEKKAKEKSWYKQDGSHGYLMVPATPGSKLKKMIETKLKAMNLSEKVKIIEKPGEKFIDRMKSSTKRDIRKPCSNPKCIVGRTEKGGNCRTNEILYEMKCKECGDLYPGETARNAHTRGIEHIEESESLNEDVREKSVLLRHMEEKHDGKKVDFEMKVLKSFQHNPLARQCAEAIRIRNTDPQKRINNKEEYHQPGDVEVKYDKNINEKFKKNKKKENKKDEESAEKSKPAAIQTIKKKVAVETNILDFLKEMRRRNDVRKESVSVENEVTATQEMIDDSRARRELAKTTSKTQFECEMCPFKSGSKNLMERHKKTHQSYAVSFDKETQFTCDKCEFTTEQKRNLEEHIKSIHEQTDYVGETQFACDQCEFTTEQKGKLAEHIKSIHDKNEFPCKQCEFKSKLKDDVVKHVESVHESKSNETRIQDEVLESNLGTGIIEEGAPSTSLATPKISAKEKKKTNTKYILKRIKCELCEKKFNKIERFDTHMKKIHKRNPVGMGPAVLN